MLFVIRIFIVLFEFELLDKVIVCFNLLFVKIVNVFVRYVVLKNVVRVKNKIFNLYFMVFFVDC